jgi:hypothetical protein
MTVTASSNTAARVDLIFVQIIVLLEPVIRKTVISKQKEQ